MCAVRQNIYIKEVSNLSQILSEMFGGQNELRFITCYNITKWLKGHFDKNLSKKYQNHKTKYKQCNFNNKLD